MEKLQVSRKILLDTSQVGAHRAPYKGGQPMPTGDVSIGRQHDLLPPEALTTPPRERMLYRNFLWQESADPRAGR